MNRLRFLRNEKGESLEKIAKYLNVTMQTISNYETEKRDMTPDTILKLAEYFNVEEELIRKAMCWYVNHNLDDWRY